MDLKENFLYFQLHEMQNLKYFWTKYLCKKEKLIFAKFIGSTNIGQRIFQKTAI